MSDLPAETPPVGEGFTSSGSPYGVGSVPGHGSTGSGAGASYDPGSGATVSGVPPAPPEDAEAPPTAPPVNVDVPFVDGIGAPGETLTCTMGNWEGMAAEPHSYSYVWQTDDAPNSAVGPTYVVVPGDAGKSISCIVTATNALGSTTAPPSNAVEVMSAARSATEARHNAGEARHNTPRR